MTDYIIETQNLSFGYSRSMTIENINLKIEKGSIYGLLGPNGAGKTTTIRLLLGLLSPGNGNIKLFGLSHTNNRIEILKNVGAMIEMPSLYEHLNGYDNLRITQKIHRVHVKRIAEVLEIVKLTEASQNKVKEYSLGMKQRLGLAICLLSEPKLLILDEPTNGLDPHGIIETRELLSTLVNEFGITILISSHLLSEVEKLVTHLGIITNGRLAFQGTFQDLYSMKQEQAVIKVQTNDNQGALETLQEHQAILDSDGILNVPFFNKDQVAQICSTLINKRFNVYDLHVVSKDLESIFLDITNN